jgi:hypothetical protein
MKFKDELVQSRYKLMHKTAQDIAEFMDNYSQSKYKIEITLTSTVSTLAEDKELKRVSDTHRTGRAFDVRVTDLPESLIAELCSVTRRKFKNVAARSKTNDELIVYKPHGTGPHLHVQINRKFSLPLIS